MKTLLIAILLFVALQSQAQIYRPENFRPEIYVDSIKYADFLYFDPSKIDSMSIVKETLKAPARTNIY